ncbi:hypothetical protein ACPCAE_04060 [Streptomyces cinereoruber]|uniref:hypothetical protein n=1 Tax=Streptomyces cinereoruber TaxID=67260 RepID=UPI003C2B4228
MALGNFFGDPGVFSTPSTAAPVPVAGAVLLSLSPAGGPGREARAKVLEAAAAIPADATAADRTPPPLRGRAEGLERWLSMARMPSRPPLPLRTWSGVLMVCAVLACLTGLARPAMAMSMSMPMAAPMTEHMTPAAWHSASESRETKVAAVVPPKEPDCPVVDDQCVAPKGTPAQDSPSPAAPVASSSGASSSVPEGDSWPHAPPEATAPPDLHRLCVSRT